MVLYLDELKEGMEIVKSISKNGKLIIHSGTIVDKDIIEILKINAIATANVNDYLIKNKVLKNKFIFFGATEEQIKDIRKKTIVKENGVEILKIDSIDVINKIEHLKYEIEKVYDKAIQNKHINFNNIKSEIENLFPSIVENKEAYLYATILKNNSNNAYKKAINIAILSSIIAIELDMNKIDIINLIMASLIYNIGKILSRQLLATFSKEESNMLKLHILKRYKTIGYKFVKKNNLDNVIANIILGYYDIYFHNQYYSNYYSNITNIQSKIIYISNRFLTILHKGINDIKYTPFEATKKIINLSNKNFDIKIIKAFQNAVGLYPNNTRVKLSNNKVARVIYQNKNTPLKPIVTIINQINTNSVYNEIEIIDLSISKDILIENVLYHI